MSNILLVSSTEQIDFTISIFFHLYAAYRLVDEITRGNSQYLTGSTLLKRSFFCYPFLHAEVNLTLVVQMYYAVY